MKRPDFDVISKRLNIDVAKGAKGKSSVGFETVNQPFAFEFLIQLLLDRRKRFGWDALDLHIRVIVDSILKACFVDRRALDGMRNQNTSRGERMVGTGADFGQHQSVVQE